MPSFLSLLLVAALLCSPPAARARSATAAPVTLNFPDADIGAVSRAMAAILGRPILVDPRVKGRMTLYTEQPVSLAQAHALYVATLRGLGHAVVESAGLLKVVPETEAKLQTGTVVTVPASPASRQGDQIVTRIFPVVHESANNLSTVLRPLISPNNLINVNPGNNTLVITDYESNLQRLATLISALDTPSATDVEVVVLQHTLASTLAVTVQKLLDGTPSSSGSGGQGGQGGGASGGSATTVLADPSLNALLIRAPHPARLAAARALIARLDQRGAGAGGSDVHVIYLKNAEATRLATVLRAAFPHIGESGRSSGGGSPAAASTGGAPAGGSSSASAASAGGSSGSAGSSQTTTPVTATAAPSTGGSIQADPATNSLIVTAAPPLLKELRAVIERLDARRAQLYVESLVVEVDASKARDVGVKWQQIFNISTLSGLTLGTVAEALESMSGTNILSTANVVTLDNEEAKIVVGQNVPFVTGSYTTTSGTSSNPFQTIERKDVGVTLRIRPQISENGSVRMTIFQESSSISSTAATGTSNAGPTTNKRSIETNVIVHDGRIVVLGGLIQDSQTDDAAEVPYLSSVPVLGALFRSRSHSRSKSNLIVFLRPVVMRDETASNQLTLDRYDFIRARQREMPEDIKDVLPGRDRPEVPDLPALQPADGR
ncbi:general secretion pathway protein D [Sphaerotilus hippei]|uniref:General secretion pathway protein D n=1 Tax=Sphaerotilus hippei TaxID=744406 RepID=A0A318H6S7_9BURK|nr:secretin N-terminal domain-containing protein [Sphaerotilus hippei]PXW93355.1 general secretion pathway protein D [Sphaerotilus hippei]